MADSTVAGTADASRASPPPLGEAQPPPSAGVPPPTSAAEVAPSSPPVDTAGAAPICGKRTRESDAVPFDGEVGDEDYVQLIRVDTSDNVCHIVMFRIGACPEDIKRLFVAAAKNTRMVNNMQLVNGYREAFADLTKHDTAWNTDHDATLGAFFSGGAGEYRAGGTARDPGTFTGRIVLFLAYDVSM